MDDIKQQLAGFAKMPLNQIAIIYGNLTLGEICQKLLDAETEIARLKDPDMVLVRREDLETIFNQNHRRSANEKERMAYNRLKAALEEKL